MVFLPEIVGESPDNTFRGIMEKNLELAQAPAKYCASTSYIVWVSA